MDEKTIVKNILSYIEKNLDEDLSLNCIEKEVHYLNIYRNEGLQRRQESWHGLVSLLQILHRRHIIIHNRHLRWLSARYIIIHHKNTGKMVYSARSSQR